MFTADTWTGVTAHCSNLQDVNYFSTSKCDGIKIVSHMRNLKFCRKLDSNYVLLGF
jgi:hypothetical protein